MNMLRRPSATAQSTRITKVETRNGADVSFHTTVSPVVAQLQDISTPPTSPGLRRRLSLGTPLDITPPPPLVQTTNNNNNNMEKRKHANINNSNNNGTPSKESAADSMRKVAAAKPLPEPPKEPGKTSWQKDAPLDLRSMLRFRTKPSRELCDFYSYLKKKEHSEENLEFWLILRNHNLLYKRYRQIKEHATGKSEISPEFPALTTLPSQSTSEEAPEFRVTIRTGNGREERHQPAGMSETSIAAMHVDRKFLRRSARHILETYLLAGSRREVNLHNSLRMRVKQLIEVEGRYDPMIFAEVRESVFEMMKKDSFPRFVKHRQPIIK